MEKIIKKVQKEFKDYIGSTSNDKEITIKFKTKEIKLNIKDITEDNIVQIIKDKLK